MALSALPHERAVFWMQLLEAQNECVMMIGSCLLLAPERCDHEVAKFGTGAHLPWPLQTLSLSIRPQEEDRMRRSSLMPRFEVLHDLVAVELGWTPLIWMRALPVMGCSEAAAGKLKAFTDWPCLQASRDGTSRRSFAAILSELLTKGLFF